MRRNLEVKVIFIRNGLNLLSTFKDFASEEKTSLTNTGDATAMVTLYLSHATVLQYNMCTRVRKKHSFLQMDISSRCKQYSSTD